MSVLTHSVRQILHNQGYAESVPGSNMFVKKKSGDMLSDSFFRVANETVKEMCKPGAPEVSHSDFVRDNTRFLYSR